MASPLPLDQILHGDCIELLQSLPASSVDLVFADPPYNLQLSQDLYRPNRKETGTRWVIGTYHNIYRVGKIMQDLGFWILNDVVWVKANPMPNFRGVRFTNAHETLIWAQKKKGAKYTFNHHDLKTLNDDSRENGLQMRSDWRLPLATGKERIRVNGAKAHSTQKPEALLYRVILASSKPGDVVLDPFFGSGTTGVVAKKLGRHFIGIEREKKYIRIAQKHIEAAAEADSEAVKVGRPEQARVPFGALVESGILPPGQSLYFAEKGLKAKILANGHIQCGKISGSIHGVAKALSNGAPVNGWAAWLYEDEKGNKIAIDELRKKFSGEA